MRTWNPLTALLAAGLAAVAGALASRADDPPKPAEPGTLVVIDAAGKEQKLKTWKFTAGTRRLSWLAPAADVKDKDKDKDKPQPPAVPEALEFREENSTNFVAGILTFIPLERLVAIQYDNDKESVTARVATGEKVDPDQLLVLVGTTKFQKINKLVIEAEVDKGDLGVAEVKYLGGVPRGIRGFRFFSTPKVQPSPAGRPAVVTAGDRKEKTAHKVADLQALYQVPNGERLLPILYFKKTLKIDVAKIKTISDADPGDSDETLWRVGLKDSNDETLTLLKTVTLDGKQAELLGLLGRVPAGYKLFPVHTIKGVKFDEDKGEEKKDK
jgi:hypothetical protein